MTSSSGRLRSSLLLLAMPLACLTGCAAIGWTVAAFAPPQKVEALYKPPKAKKILVFVDDITNPISYEPVKRKLTEKLNEQLLEHEVAAKTIDYEKLLDLISVAPSFNELGVVQVGRKLGADIVLYVNIEEFALKEDPEGPLWRGTLRASVRMVDVQAKSPQLWPTDRDNYPVGEVQTPATDDSSPTYGVEVARMLAEQMADKVAKLFYDHRVPVAFGD
ncbi:MAG: hypothetical protein KAU28_11270 [Phycisphaerae bacterium]|nr:hypothetical protein [Phycisphaerae bacterium]